MLPMTFPSPPTDSAVKFYAVLLFAITLVLATLALVLIERAGAELTSMCASMVQRVDRLEMWAAESPDPELTKQRTETARNLIKYHMVIPTTVTVCTVCIELVVAILFLFGAMRIYGEAVKVAMLWVEHDRASARLLDLQIRQLTIQVETAESESGNSPSKSGLRHDDSESATV